MGICAVSVRRQVVKMGNSVAGSATMQAELQKLFELRGVEHSIVRECEKLKTRLSHDLVFDANTMKTKSESLGSAASFTAGEKVVQWWR